MDQINVTHDPQRRSWVESANDGASDFPIQNLPLGRFRTGTGPARCGIAIGDYILDLGAVAHAGVFTGAAAQAVRAADAPDLLALAQHGVSAVSALRHAVSDLLRADGAGRAAAAAWLVPMRDVELLVPMPVAQFTDMCLSAFHHGRNRGADAHGNPGSRPVFKWLPIGYNGRASTVVVSGTPVRRPVGQWYPRGDDMGGAPRYAPEPRLDYELELGLWVAGPGNALGEPIAIGDAARHILGYTLINDWSARRMQVWENALGPFLAKSIATTTSPWIVTAEALAPFRVPAFARFPGDPELLPHLDDPEDRRAGGIDLRLCATLASTAMRDAGTAPVTLCDTNYAYTYWSWAQVIAHHSSNGCTLSAGDLIASGTASGPALEEAACMNERTVRGTQALALPGGETRTYFEDGDEVVISARAERDGFVSIGFGTATGRIAPARLVAA